MKTKGVQTMLRKLRLLQVLVTSAAWGIDGSKGAQGRSRQAHDTRRSYCCNGQRFLGSSHSSRADRLRLLGGSILVGSSSHGGRLEESQAAGVSRSETFAENEPEPSREVAAST